MNGHIRIFTTRIYISYFGDGSVAQLVALMSGVVLGGIAEVVGSNPSFFGDGSVAQLVALMSGVVLGGVAEVVGSNLARGKIFTASIGSVDSLYPSVFIYCLNLHQFLESNDVCEIIFPHF